MCGIVGYVGAKNKAIDTVLEGLETLEYRGYDSAGIAYIEKDTISVHKAIGRVQALHDDLGPNVSKNTISIGHTRWATHGSPTVYNAHPHTNQDGSIAVVHNGIIENYEELRDFLKKKGYNFVSETDSEVIPHLLDYHLRKTRSFRVAFLQTLKALSGTFGLVVMTTHEPDVLFAARLGSPLVLGITNTNAIIFASDPAALIAHTKKVVFLNDYEYVIAKQDGTYALHDFMKDTKVVRDPEILAYDAEEAQLGDFAHFMLKEIYEVPQTIRSATLGRIKAEEGIVKLGGLEAVSEQLNYIDRIVIVACGTSYYAGLVGEYLIEEIAGIPVEVQYASEFKYRDEPFSRSTALLAISQSGETADTIAALKKVEDFGVLRLGIVNAVGSTIARMTDAGVYCHAGPERAVASTKAFVAQVTVLAQMALYLSKGNSPLYKPLLKELDALPQKAEQLLKLDATIQKMAKKYAHYNDFLFIGRKYDFPSALEGALKLKEISYIHAEGFAAGEMKHGPLAMIEPAFPTFAIAPNGSLLPKTVSNIEEIRARKGKVVAIGTQGNTQLKRLVDDVLYMPDTLEQTTPILSAIILQLFAYYVALERGHNVDRPRNLAKSVTVE